MRLWPPAHNALHYQVGLASCRSLGGDWRRRPGRPRARWTDQLRNDTGSVPANLWRQAILRGLRGYGGATRRPKLATRWRRWRTPQALTPINTEFLNADIHLSAGNGKRSSTNDRPMQSLDGSVGELPEMTQSDGQYGTSYLTNDKSSKRELSSTTGGLSAWLKNRRRVQRRVCQQILNTALWMSISIQIDSTSCTRIRKNQFLRKSK